MQDLLKNIIDMDEKAREMTLQAEEAMHKSEQEIEELKVQIYNDFIARAKERVEKNIAVDTENAEKQRKEYAERITQAKENLQRVYDENSDQWVDEIVNNIIG